MFRHLFAATIVLLATLQLGAIASDFTRDTIPKKWFEPLIPEALPPLQYPKYFTDLEKAKAQAFAGRYKLALQTLRSVKTGDAAQIVLIKSECLSATGRDEEALAALSDPGIAADPRVQVARAALLNDLDRAAEAIALLKLHLNDHPESLRGHYELGRISESLGDFETARAMFGWFAAAPQSYLDKWRGQHERLFENAEDATIVGRALDRWATLTGQYQHDSATARHDPGLVCEVL